ncbi:hypothetical protein F5879DRAFT_1072811 [Lentinula edodes]|nr:hypothetical protein F5879DRAFT_1072811 [Lentinula edodes]
MDVELKDLQTTLANIEEARSFRNFLVLDIDEAHPRISETVETINGAFPATRRSQSHALVIPT